MEGRKLSDQAQAVGPHGPPAGMGPAPAEPQPDSETGATNKMQVSAQEMPNQTMAPMPPQAKGEAQGVGAPTASEGREATRPTEPARGPRSDGPASTTKGEKKQVEMQLDEQGPQEGGGQQPGKRKRIDDKEGASTMQSPQRLPVKKASPHKRAGTTKPTTRQQPQAKGGTSPYCPL